MIKLERFTCEHWLLLTRDTSRKSVLQGRIREQCGVAYSAIEDGLILGSAGVIAENRAGALWALLTDDLKQRHPRWLHRTAKRLLIPVIEAMDLVRIDATIDPENKMNQKWIEKLGITNHRIKERAGIDGRNVLEYSLVLKDKP